jgi:hypothetical protein
MFHNMLEFLRWWVVSPPPNPQAGGPAPVGCPRLLIQYIRSYPPYLEAVSSIHNLKMCHAVVTGDPLNMGSLPFMFSNLNFKSVPHVPYPICAIYPAHTILFYFIRPINIW